MSEQNQTPHVGQSVIVQFVDLDEPIVGVVEECISTQKWIRLKVGDNRIGGHFSAITEASLFK